MEVTKTAKFFAKKFSKKYFEVLWNFIVKKVTVRYLLERDTAKDTMHKISANFKETSLANVVTH